MEIIFIPVVGLEKISDKMQMIGAIPILYANKAENTMANSLALLKFLC